MTEPTHEGHLVLVVEDDPRAGAVLSDVVRSRGDRVRLATTVSEGLAALAEATPCYAILDQQLPLDPHARAFVTGGERMMTAVRSANPRRVRDFHEMPILVVTAYSEDRKFVSRMYDLGASGFLPKPLDDAAIDELGEQIRTVLDRVGRLDHARCRAGTEVVAPSPTPGPPAAAPVVPEGAVRIAIDGRKDGALERVMVQGQIREVQVATFVVLLRLIVEHQRAPGAWASRTALGIVGNRSISTRLRNVFAGAVPEGFDVMESDQRGHYRLHPRIVVEHVGWKALCDHPDGRVEKVAKGRVGRGAK